MLWGRRNPLGPTFRAVVGQLQKNLKLLDLPENATVLDIGAGDGLASITLSRVHPDIGHGNLFINSHHCSQILLLFHYDYFIISQLMPPNARRVMHVFYV